MRSEIHVFIAALLLSTIGLFTKLIGTDIHPMVIGFYRVFLGMIILAIISPFIDKTTFKPKKKDFGMYILIGLLFAIIFTFVCVAYTLAPINNVVLILSISPFFVLIFAHIILKEKITKKKIITLLITIVGLIILNPITSEREIGNLIAIGVTIVIAIMITLMRKEDSTHSIGDVFWFLFFATIFTLPLAIIYGFGKINIFVIAIGVLSTGLAYLFYNLGLERLDAETTSVIITIITPIAAIILAMIFLQEKLTTNVIIGGIILLFAGIFLELHIQKKMIKKRSKRHIFLLHSK